MKSSLQALFTNQAAKKQSMKRAKLRMLISLRTLRSILPQHQVKKSMELTGQKMPLCKKYLLQAILRKSKSLQKMCFTSQR